MPLLLLRLLTLLIGLTLLAACSAPPLPPSSAKIVRDPRWSDYGRYLNTLVDTVELEWHAILAEQHLQPPRNCSVTISFSLNSQGEVDVLKVEDQGCGKPATWACLQALQRKQPYATWSAPMIATLGESQTLTFSFVYR